MPDSHQQMKTASRSEERIQLNSTIIPGAPYLMLKWYHKPIGPSPEEHVLVFDEYVALLVRIQDSRLGGTVRFYVGGKWLVGEKRHRLHTGGLTHCRMMWRTSETYLHFSAHPAGNTSC
jgi:hypothetical protein